MIKEELETVAFLARMGVSENEKEKYLKDLNYMLEYVEVLQEPDISTLTPTTHVTELRNVWREDVVRECPQDVRDQILKAAPEREGNFFKIKKVIEAE
jgi:aspartyl/glutamyl-tRNA(Asn/Gln) amidotransferase C subunit